MCMFSPLFFFFLNPNPAFIKALLKYENVTKTNFLDTVFSNDSITVDGITFGPYRSGGNTSDEEDYCNPGPAYSYIYSMDLRRHPTIIKNVSKMYNNTCGEKDSGLLQKQTIFAFLF